MSEISGIPPPNSNDIPLLDPAGTLPTPASESPLADVASPPSPPSSSIIPEIPIPKIDSNSNPIPKRTPEFKTLLSWAPLYLSKTDRAVERLSIILKSPGDTDSLLNALCYSSLLVSVVLRKLVAFQEGEVRRRAEAVVKVLVGGSWEGGVDLSTILKGSGFGLGKIGKESIEDIAGRLKTFSGLISRVRTFLRLFGLVSVWKGGKAVLLRLKGGERSGGIALDSVGVLVGLCYQIAESGAYLSGKGVLGWDAQRQMRANVWSSRFWGVSVGLDLVRLAREYKGLKEEKRKTGGKEREKASKMEETLEEKEIHVKRKVAIDLAYAPLTVHWGLENGLVSEAWVGILGTVAGGLGLREKWRLAGLELEKN